MMEAVQAWPMCHHAPLLRRRSHRCGGHAPPRVAQRVSGRVQLLGSPHLVKGTRVLRPARRIDGSCSAPTDGKACQCVHACQAVVLTAVSAVRSSCLCHARPTQLPHSAPRVIHFAAPLRISRVRGHIRGALWLQRHGRSSWHEGGGAEQAPLIAVPFQPWRDTCTTRHWRAASISSRPCSSRWRGAGSSTVCRQPHRNAVEAVVCECSRRQGGASRQPSIQWSVTQSRWWWWWWWWWLAPASNRDDTGFSG